MTKQAIDLDRLRVELRRMNRDELLTVADRAIALVPASKLRQLVGGIVALDGFVDGPRAATPLLDEVRRFHAAATQGDYYQSFAVNSKNYMDKSRGTETFTDATPAA